MRQWLPAWDVSHLAIVDADRPLPSPVVEATRRRAAEYRLGRLRAEVGRHDCNAILLYDPVNIFYALDVSEPCGAFGTLVVRLGSPNAPQGARTHHKLGGFVVARGNMAPVGFRVAEMYAVAVTPWSVIRR